MLARIAHELFWLGRHVARADHTARMLDGAMQADLQGRADDPGAVSLSWEALLTIMGARVDGTSSREDVLAALTADENNPASVVACLANAREGARQLRDVISGECWEAVNTTHLALWEGASSAPARGGPYAFHRYVRERTALFWGLTGSTMLRDDARAFLHAGGRLESADMVLRMLRVALAAGPSRDGQAMALLHACGGLQAFNRATGMAPMADAVARFLLFERAYPDSVAASVDAARRELESADAQPRASEPVLRLARLSADLEFQRRSGAGEGQTLAERFEGVATELAEVDIDIAQRYFAGAIEPHLVVA
jgi:uncharacterized alpha-E superfamily protein